MFAFLLGAAEMRLLQQGGEPVFLNVGLGSFFCEVFSLQTSPHPVLQVCTHLSDQWQHLF